MKRKNCLIGVLMLLLISTFIGLNSQKIYANSYLGKEIIINETFTAGSLGAIIEAAKVDVNTITSLTITEGMVNLGDIKWIKGNLVNLEVLEISGNATVHSVCFTPTTPNNIVPGAMSFS